MRREKGRERGYKQLAGRGSVGAEEEGKKGGLRRKVYLD
jgi:hypothetical protein